MSDFKSLTDWSVEPTNVGKELAICLVGNSVEYMGKRIKTTPVELLKIDSSEVHFKTCSGVYMLFYEEMNMGKIKITQNSIDILNRKRQFCVTK